MSEVPLYEFPAQLTSYMQAHDMTSHMETYNLLHLSSAASAALADYFYVYGLGFWYNSVIFGVKTSPVPRQWCDPEPPNPGAL